MKLGREVEGRLKNLRTLLVDAQEVIAKGAEEIATIARSHGAIHVLISAVDGSINDIKEGVTYLAHHNFAVSVETHTYPKWSVDGVGIVLVIKSDDFWKLRPTDQIKFVDSSLNVKMATVETMVVTHPSAFDEDIEL